MDPSRIDADRLVAQWEHEEPEVDRTRYGGLHTSLEEWGWLASEPAVLVPMGVGEDGATVYRILDGRKRWKLWKGLRAEGDRGLPCTVFGSVREAGAAMALRTRARRPAAWRRRAEAVEGAASTVGGGNATAVDRHKALSGLLDTGRGAIERMELVREVLDQIPGVERRGACEAEGYRLERAVDGRADAWRTWLSRRDADGERLVGRPPDAERVETLLKAVYGRKPRLCDEELPGLLVAFELGVDLEAIGAAGGIAEAVMAQRSPSEQAREAVHAIEGEAAALTRACKAAAAGDADEWGECARQAVRAVGLLEQCWQGLGRRVGGIVGEDGHGRG